MWKWKSLSPVWLCDPGQNTGVGSYSLLQGIFPTQGSNLGLQHCKRILYQLSHQGSTRILERVAYHFSRGSSQPRDQTQVSCIAGRFFTSWATREALGRCHAFYLQMNLKHMAKLINNQFWMADAWFCIFLLSQKNIFLGVYEEHSEHVWLYGRGQQTFSVKDQVVNILGFAGFMVSFVTT